MVSKLNESLWLVFHNFFISKTKSNFCMFLQLDTIVFFFFFVKVLHTIILGIPTESENSGLTQPSMNEDFDPNILLDNIDKSTSPNVSPSKNQQQHQHALLLCVKTVLAHLVTHLGHFPMAIGAPRLSSLVVEHDDVPNFSSDELSANIFTAPNILVCFYQLLLF